MAERRFNLLWRDLMVVPKPVQQNPQAILSRAELLDALQQNEKAEQKKQLLARRAAARQGGKDW